MSENRTVLSYKDSLLRESDVNLLRGPHWLNDTLISFYFEYLGHELFPHNSALLFVPPEVTQCIKIMPSSEIGVMLEPLVQPTNKQFIFFALNDNEFTDSSGGTHWSLLVLSRPEKMIFHYDSSRGSNESHAHCLAEKLLRYFSLPVLGRTHEINCLQQNNGYDCGVHLLCNAEEAAHHCTQFYRIMGCPKIETDTVLRKRNDILLIIAELASKFR